MKTLMRFVIIISLAAILAGCASRQEQYAQPLYELEVLDKPQDPAWKIEGVTAGQLASIEPGQRPPIDSDEAGIWMAMDNVEEKIKTSGNLIVDEELDKYLHGVLCRIAQEHCGDIRIYVVRMPYFNASMAPNGSLVIWSGLLLRVRNEAELASVLGHELGHYLRRHSLQQMRRAIDTTGFLAVIQVATAAVGVGFAGDLAYLAGAGTIQAYSRDMEREADGYGLALMTRAGYRPHAVTELWRQVIKEKEADEDKKFSTLLFDSHPPGEERLAALEELADRTIVNGGDVEYGTERYQEIIAPHRFSFLEDELTLRNFKRTEVLLNNLLEGGGSPGETYYFLGELYRLRGLEGDRDLALDAYEQAISQAQFPPEAFRALALLHQKIDSRDKASGYFTKYLELKPDAVDREMIIYMLSRSDQ
jgi:Zn-dependent protease with chaperone function